MSWSLDDLANWARSITKTFQGKNPSIAPGSSADAAIVQPLKTAADFTGITQGIQGFSPNASTGEKLLALLSLTGAATGPGSADDIARAALKNLDNRYVYGIHINPEQMGSVPKKIKPTKDSVARYGRGAEPMYNAFFGFGKSPSEIPERAFDSSLKWGRAYWDGTASVVRAPKKGLARDVRSPVGYKTRKNLKVIDSVAFDSVKDTPEYEALAEEFADGIYTLLDKELLKKLVRQVSSKNKR